jgi:hypothetical protein
MLVCFHWILPPPDIQHGTRRDYRARTPELSLPPLPTLWAHTKSSGRYKADIQAGKAVILACVLFAAKSLNFSSASAIVRSLLEVRLLLAKTDYFYHFNRIYLDDYCVWAQGIRYKIEISIEASIPWHISISYWVVVLLLLLFILSSYWFVLLC